MAPIGAAGPQCLAGSPQQACHTEPHHQPKTAPTQNRAPLNTLFIRRAWNASSEHEKGPATGAIGVQELRRSVRFLRWALPVQRVNIRGKPPIPPKGALMQTLFACDSPPYSRNAASRSWTRLHASCAPPTAKPSSATSRSSARASLPLTTPQSSVVIRPSTSAAS